MRIEALATDGDGTCTVNGRMSQDVYRALQRWRTSGRRAILVTGETKGQLKEFPHLELFDLVVGENGAILYDPAGEKCRVLCQARPETLLKALQGRDIHPLRQGEVLLATRVDQAAVVREVVQELGLDWRLVPNRKDVMLLPPGVNKATGLRYAAAELGLFLEQIAAIGDAENDKDLLACCGLGVAVQDAVSELKVVADRTTLHVSNRGFVELIDSLLQECGSRSAAKAS